ncbi:prephenate dehydratase [Acididesulfobacillus acetoxydans]|uniref:Prephenate dehydratase n=1 Tax=Acididesulfobacillus acetoxydans TaxID=1561005 RepID=A0A8S0Y2P9_9FIRM|nr:prephenate dehydratase [Acididesulfobacillus acetoxydans]CAA7601075.1 prephenate dehydratase [Acididesulfobacillus acetoxydans]CEJ06949.1 P-protein [Acididesulfobacillus acetoxydans]
MKRMGYLGPKGSFSEEALHYFVQVHQDLLPLDYQPFSTIPRLLLACDRKEIDWAFVPLENSTEGQMGVTMDTLGQIQELYITREFVHPVDHCLLTPEPLPLPEIQRVYAHEQALAQCREFLDTHLAQAEQIPCFSTAEAAGKISSVREPWAAIGPRRAAQLYHLHLQEERIQDGVLNATRFVLVGPQLAEMSGDDKTSFLVTTENSPGSLYRILHELAVRRINMTRIESRPSKQKLGEYVFFIDVDGYVFSPAIQEVLEAFREKSVFAKLLGSYAKAHPDESVF